MFDRIQYICLKAITSLLGLGLMVMIPLSYAFAFYDGPLWDAHSHVDIGSGGNETRADSIANAISGAAAGTSIQGYVIPQDLPGVGRVMLFPKKHLDNYMLNTLVAATALQNRLINAIGFQNDPSTAGANDGWRLYESSNPVSYNPTEDAFLNKVEACAAGGSYQWLGEVALYGKEGEQTEIKADLFDPVIRDRILRVMRIAASNKLPVTIHHTVTDAAGNPIGNLNNTGGSTETAAERFLSILQTHVNDVINDPDIEDPATVIWAHWGGLSTPQAIQGMIDQFSNLYFDLAWFHKGSLTTAQNRLLNSGCGILNLMQCDFTPDWTALLSSNPGRFLSGVDTGTNSDYRDKYQARELILRTALGGLTYDAAESIAANNLQQLFSIVPPPVAEGDINLDCMVNAGDVLLGLQVLSSSATLSPLQLEHSDVAPLVSGIPAPDDLFTLGDLQVILRKVLGLINL